MGAVMEREWGALEDPSVMTLGQLAGAYVLETALLPAQESLVTVYTCLTKLVHLVIRGSA